MATSTSRLPPIPTDDNAWWIDAWNRGQLLVQECGACETLRHPPQPACPACGAWEWSARPVSGSGQVYSFTVSHHPPSQGLTSPFVIALIELDEGPRVVANLIVDEPRVVEIGMRVVLEFTSRDESARLPQFRPEG
jgi:uncharacterized OB-fold protein